MQAKDAIRSVMNSSMMVFKTYFSDLDDAELMLRPGPGCNHLAWQIGHLTAAEVMLLEMICPGKAVQLPEGFEEAHAKENAASDDSSQFNTKAEYLEMMDHVRNATLSALASFPEEKLDDPAPEGMRAFCPTTGDLFLLIGTHPMMHAGQFVPIRRQLGKPVLI